MKLAVYPKYKRSHVEWLGGVPQHWEVHKITRGFEMIASGTTPKSDSPEYYDGDVPWVTTSELRETTIHQTKQSVSREALRDYPTLRIYPIGTVLFAMYGATIGRLGVLGIPATVNQACCAFSSPTKFDNRFVYYWLWMRRPILISLSSGGGQPNLSQDDLRQLRIPVPELDEQRAIANFLDRETARLDTLVRKKRELIEKLKEKRTALISRTVTRGLNPNVKLKPSGIEWLGNIPEHWETPPLYTRYSIELGKMLNEGRITGKHLVPYLRNIDVQWDHINFSDLPEMDITNSEKSRYTLAEGDLVVCEGGEVGRAAIFRKADKPVGYQKALHRMRPLRAQEVPRFMFYTLFWASSHGIFVSEGNPNTIPHLTGEKLRRYRFPTPRQAEQRAIADYLDRETAKIDKMMEKVEAAIEKLQEYRTALITAAVTGKIDVQAVDR
jgi:type I restriction enzyme, S subunit